jgi:hypothetical protein
MDLILESTSFDGASTSTLLTGLVYQDALSAERDFKAQCLAAHQAAKSKHGSNLFTFAGKQFDCYMFFDMDGYTNPSITPLTVWFSKVSMESVT